jgi:TonB family protein
MQNRGSGNILALAASVILHMLLLLIPWQPAGVVELFPLEGVGTIELAAISPMQGQPEALANAVKPTADNVPEKAPVKEAEPAKVIVKEVPTKVLETTKAPFTPAEIPTSKQPIVDVIKSVSGTIPVASDDTLATNKALGTNGAPVENAQGEAAQAMPAAPSYPGDDPTGEAMVASKRTIAYPKDSMSSASFGDVQVEVYVSIDGKITSTKVLESPGDARLESVAVQTILRYWEFKPAERAYKVIIQVSFTIEPIGVIPRFISASFI